ncbi:spermidine synthase [Nocardioides sp. zg-579]|uniref:Spermidine synthase n=1 Tax=Nocardioides marmotae TaxID=2663857 RepID=A0A6I3IVC9_9ACTN|nr:fused MFS/spermidine synthase [Nocardioides marmotae]MCR6030759.1 spermidine synthase [Gordonia jinghuaiqii]MTB94393.1 spermidine synthase [Nocardioides marmotae]QKE01581.1 fused MFS/spermidine synthase [Nocardioides marmotae]
MSGPRHEIVPADRRDAWLVRLDGRDQSYVDLADPTHLAFDYVRRLGDVVDLHRRAGEPTRVVHVGGAGLTLPRYVAAIRPGSWQVVLEPDEELTAAVREQLPLPRRSGIRVRPVDGLAGVAALREDCADLVVLDAYAAGRVPAELVTTAFFADVARVLVPGGWFLLNLSDRAPFAATRDAIAGLRSVFRRTLVAAEPATLRARRPGNLTVVAGPDDSLAEALAARASGGALAARVLGHDRVSDSFGGGTGT